MSEIILTYFTTRAVNADTPCPHTTPQGWKGDMIFSTPVSLDAQYFDGGHDACSRFVFCSGYVFENNLMQQHI